jgi:hypothetical protein
MHLILHVMSIIFDIIENFIFYKKIKVFILEEVIVGSSNYLPSKNYSPSFHQIHKIIMFKHQSFFLTGSFNNELQNSLRLNGLPSFLDPLQMTSKSS